MKDKTVLITGATSGIGQATAKALAAQGATVIVQGRSLERCQETVKNIKLETGNPSVDYLVADLSIQAQVRELAEQIRRRYSQLNVLVNNAGGAFVRRILSADGIEMTFALNHLNYFILTNLLLEMLKKCTSARIVNVSSNSHFGQNLDFNDLQLEHHYWVLRAYGRSKLANILFTYELARRLVGTGITANALHPGFVATRIGGNNGLPVRLAMQLVHRKALSPEEGAHTVVYLASSPEVAGVSGFYYVNKRAIRSDPVSYDQAAADRLWHVSAALTGTG